MGAIYCDGIWYIQGKEGQIHSGFTPIGTIIAVMGKTAPMNYLACDGQIVNIANYPELATYFMTQFEANNYFGGDGVTTFAMPDLRGEFLRGTGTNSHSNGGDGSDVGEHQDPTAHVQLILNQGKYFGPSHDWNDGTKQVSTNIDKQLVARATNSVPYVTLAQGTDSSSEGKTELYASRPTNTSVLYCIATKNIFMDAGNNYSTEEQVVGTWIDGKPIYQRTYTDTAFGAKSNAWTNTDITIENVAQLVSVNAYNITTSPNSYVNLNYRMNGNMLQYYSISTTWTGISICTVRYTKTTDIVDI